MSRTRGTTPERVMISRLEGHRRALHDAQAALEIMLSTIVAE